MSPREIPVFMISQIARVSHSAGILVLPSASVLQKGVNHASLRILLHEVLLMGLQCFLHGRSECQLVVAAVVNRHCFRPKLVDIGAGFILVVQNVNFGQFRVHRDWNKAAVACAVTGQKILPIGRASKDTLAQTVGRMGFVGDFIGFLLFAEKTLDFFDALGIGGGDHQICIPAGTHA